MGILRKFFTKITKTKISLDDDFLEKLEEIFIEADIGITTCQMIM